jgi:two-component system sensor histidine kinase KdpD
MERRLRGRHCAADVAGDLPLVQIDGVLIEQVLMNLLDNAVEYTPAGSAISIRARAVGGAIEVEVADEGAGLPPGTEDRVFDKFFRAGHAGTRRGIGLGLAICRGIIDAHGGRIFARNRPSGGAAFTFTLPIEGAPPAMAEGEAEPLVAASATPQKV